MQTPSYSGQQQTVDTPPAYFVAIFPYVPGKDLSCSTFLDLRKTLLDIIIKLHKKLGFSHNDIRSPNIVVNDKCLHLIDYEYAIVLDDALHWEYIRILLEPLNIFKGFLQFLGISTFDAHSIFTTSYPSTHQLKCFLQLLDIYGALKIMAEHTPTHKEIMLKYIHSPPPLLYTGQTYSEFFKLEQINHAPEITFHALVETN